MLVAGQVAGSQAIAFLSSGAKEADQALDLLVGLYGNCPLAEANVIVAPMAREESLRLSFTKIAPKQ